MSTATTTTTTALTCTVCGLTVEPTHPAVVVAVDEDGTISYLHRHRPAPRPAPRWLPVADAIAAAIGITAAGYLAIRVLISITALTIL